MKNFFAIPVGFLLVLVSLGVLRADDLILNGDFEKPAVKQRTPRELGGDPVNGGVKSSWKNFTLNSPSGALTAGLTNEIAHSGAQSLYVKFDNVSKGYENASLETAPIPIGAGSPYRIGLWGRVDKTNPLILGDRPAYLKLKIEFFKEDGATPAGEAEYKLQPIPGAKNRDPIFTADTWREFFTEIKSAGDAAFMVITVKFETSSNPGKTNGIIYFDDFSIKGLPSEVKEPKSIPVDAAEPTAGSEMK